MVWVFLCANFTAQRYDPRKLVNMTASARILEMFQKTFSYFPAQKNGLKEVRSTNKM